MHAALTDGQAGPFLIAWGVVWMVGFSGTYVLPDRAGTIWAFAGGGGLILAGLLLARRDPVR